MADDAKASVQQAALFVARERTRLLRGFVLDIPRTHMVRGASAMAASIPADSFGSRNAIATFKTRLKMTAASGQAGLLFAFGDATGAVALWWGSDTITFRAGGATVATDASEVSVTFGFTPPIDWELTVVAMVRPDGLVGLWLPEYPLITWNSDGVFSAWANNVAGDFAQAASQSLPADVTQTGAPTNFDLVEPLSVYYGSLPRINIGSERGA